MDEELYELLKQKRKIEAVKYVRNKYDMDFKRAKETVDNLTEKVEYFEGKNRGLSKEEFHDMFKNSIISRIYDNDLYALIRENRKIEAAKYVKDKYNFDLEKAKNIVDSLDINNLMAFTEKNIVSASKTDFSKCGSGYRNESYSYEMIDGKQHFFAYKDGEKREVGRTAIPSEILKWFEKAGEKASDEYEDKEYRKKNIFWGILLVALIVGIYFYFN